MRESDRKRFRDITGQRFGRLVAIRYIGPSNYGALWLCQCDCGTEKVISRKNLQKRSGPTRSCGCLSRKWGQRHFPTIRVQIPIVDMIAKRFGRLSVVGPAGTNEHGAFWLCDCDCGGHAVVLGHHLRSRQTNSCGCLQREVASEMGRRNAWQRLERYITPESIFNVEVL